MASHNVEPNPLETDLLIRSWARDYIFHQQTSESLACSSNGNITISSIRTHSIRHKFIFQMCKVKEAGWKYMHCRCILISDGLYYSSAVTTCAIFIFFLFYEIEVISDLIYVQSSEFESKTLKRKKF